LSVEKQDFRGFDWLIAGVCNGSSEKSKTKKWVKW
jgi:hypothetical protein